MHKKLKRYLQIRRKKFKVSQDQIEEMAARALLFYLSDEDVLRMAFWEVEEK